MATVETETEFNLYALVMAALDDGLGDAREVAEHLLLEIPEHLYGDALLATLPLYVRDCDHKRRDTRSNHRAANPSSKWDAARELRDEIDVLRWVFTPRGQRKFFAECDAKDCVDIAVHLESVAAGAADRARRMRIVAKQISKANVKRVADIEKQVRRVFALNAEEVEKIFNA